MTIVIVGAGAAGMMAAWTAHETSSDARIILIEKNAVLGRKVSISGGGRCNVTTGFEDVKVLLTKYPRGGKFLTTAMYHFSPAMVYDWFEAHGVPLKIEKDMRVFPQSDIGTDVVDTFERLFNESSIEVLMKEQVISVQRSGSGFAIELKHAEPITADKFIVASGGQAYRHTGSTGDGYAFAEALGHTVTPLSSSLNSFITAEQWPKERSGVSFTDVMLFVLGNKKVQARGPIVLTHQGVSGPAVFALAAQVAHEAYNKENPLTIAISFAPDFNEEQMFEYLRAAMEQHPKEQIKKTIHEWLPFSVAETALAECGMEPGIKNAEVGKKHTRMLAQWLVSCTLHAVGRGAGAEFVTAGGVPTAEIDERTMESRITPGLYFAGEIIDQDGLTGGFNLQAAWATGRLAGENAARA